MFRGVLFPSGFVSHEFCVPAEFTHLRVRLPEPTEAGKYRVSKSSDSGSGQLMPTPRISTAERSIFGHESGPKERLISLKLSSDSDVVAGDAGDRDGVRSAALLKSDQRKSEHRKISVRKIVFSSRQSRIDREIAVGPGCMLEQTFFVKPSFSSNGRSSVLRQGCLNGSKKSSATKTKTANRACEAMMRDTSRVFAMQPHAHQQKDYLLIQVGDFRLTLTGCHQAPVHQARVHQARVHRTRVHQARVHPVRVHRAGGSH